MGAWALFCWKLIHSCDNISYLRKCIIIGTCSEMDAAYMSIIDLSLCPFFPADCCYPFLLKFRLFLLRWNSIEFHKALFQSSIRATKCIAGIWHVLILNVKMKFAQTWNWLTLWFFRQSFNCDVYFSACHIIAHVYHDRKIITNQTGLLLLKSVQERTFFS